MSARVLIIGGYGNFGSIIARRLADDPAITLLIAGRSRDRAEALVAGLSLANAAEAHGFDVFDDPAGYFARLKPDIVIHTTGPFQRQDYRVARAAIAAGAHYIDLADARNFVCGINALDDAAKAAGVLVVSGASSVPCLTAAIIDEHLPLYDWLERVDYGISIAQDAGGGPATVAAGMSYVGKPFEALRDGTMARVYGWEETHAETYPGIGRRLFGNCDVPDLTLFPERYPTLKYQRFAAGTELAPLHLATRAMGILVRMGMIGSLDRLSVPLLTMARMFDRFGSGKSGFHMHLSGIGENGRERTDSLFLIAAQGHGPNIPCVPAIVLAKRLAAGKVTQRGATPCLDLITLTDYLAELEGFDIRVERRLHDAAR